MDSWSYWQDNRGAQALLAKTAIEPQDIHPETFVEDQLRYLEISSEMGDDLCRTAMPLASLPWMEAILGCPVISAGTYLSSRPVGEDPDRLGQEPFDPQNPWVQKYLEFIHVYHQAFGVRYPIAQSILRGPSDLACALMGAEKATIALLEQPEAMSGLLERVTSSKESFLRLQLEHLPGYEGGSVIGQYEIWAPGKTVRLQEDYSTLYSPKLYVKFLKPLDQRLAGIAEYSLIHLHSSSLFLIERFLEVEQLRLFQVTKDEGTASLPQMLPNLKKIQSAGRPLIVKGRFDASDFQLLREELSPCGLCIQPVVSSVKEAMMRLAEWQSQ
jgi:hypothetical protein